MFCGTHRTRVGRFWPGGWACQPDEAKTTPYPMQHRTLTTESQRVGVALARGLLYNVGMTDKWLTTLEAARLTGYTSDHVRRLIALGKIEGLKRGRDWLVKQSSLLSHVRKVSKLGAKRGPKTLT